MWPLFWALLLICCLILGKSFHLSLSLLGIVFFPILLPHLAMLNIPGEQFFLVWMAGAEHCEALVTATVLKKVPNSLKSELLWGQPEASIGLSAEGCSLGKALPRRLNIPGSSLHCRDRRDALKRVIVKRNFILASGKGTQGNTKCSKNWFQRKSLDQNTSAK